MFCPATVVGGVSSDAACPAASPAVHDAVPGCRGAAMYAAGQSTGGSLVHGRGGGAGAGLRQYVPADAEKPGGSAGHRTHGTTTV